MIPSRYILTQQQWENPPWNEDVFPVGKSGFPAIAMLVYWRMYFMNANLVCVPKPECFGHFGGHFPYKACWSLWFTQTWWLSATKLIFYQNLPEPNKKKSIHTLPTAVQCFGSLFVDALHREDLLWHLAQHLFPEQHLATRVPVFKLPLFLYHREWSSTQ